MAGIKGQRTWTKGLTKETDERIRKAVETRIRLYREGKLIIWNKGKSKKDFPQLSNSGVKKGNIPWSKGKTGLHKCSEETKEYLRKLYTGRKISEKQKIFLSISRRGKNNPAWRGGTSFLPYPPNWITLRNKIKKRDKYTCQICKKGSKSYSRFDTHHIDYNKKNNKMNNLIALCRKCHSKTLTNRLYWIEYFIMGKYKINSN